MRFWVCRTQTRNLLKSRLASTELFDIINYKEMESFKDQVANTSFHAATIVPSTSPEFVISSASLPTESATGAVSSASVTIATDSAKGAILLPLMPLIPQMNPMPSPPKKFICNWTTI
ncbi:unnamed protein product [Absidia cylindrospora]